MAQSKTKRIKRSKKTDKRTEIKGIKKILNQPRISTSAVPFLAGQRTKVAEVALRGQPRSNSKEFQRGEETKTMATKDILEKAKKELADLTGFKSPSAIGFKKEGNELMATIEIIEKESIPDGMDILGTYEVRVDEGGKIISYERTDLRKRVDTALGKEV